MWPATAVSLAAHSVSASQIGGAASAQMQLLSTGVAQGVRSPGATSSYSPEWLLAGTASDYEARWTNTSGSITTGTAATWQNLGTTRAYGIARGSSGLTSCTGTLEIRNATTLTVMATATIQLDAEWA